MESKKTLLAKSFCRVWQDRRPQEPESATQFLVRERVTEWLLFFSRPYIKNDELSEFVYKRSVNNLDIYSHAIGIRETQDWPHQCIDTDTIDR